MGCRTCIPNKNEIKIVTSNKKPTEIKTELDLIDKIIEKRNQTLINQTNLTLDINLSEDIFKNEFFEDINNEKKLCHYLDIQKTSNNKEYESILFLYFNILSPENKEKYSNITFPSNIDQYINLSESIKNGNFNQDNYLTEIDIRKLLIEKKIITIYPKLSKMVDEEKHSQNSNKTNELKLEI